MPSLQDYKKALADKIYVSIDDLTQTEVDLINASFSIFNDRVGDLKALEDEVKRLSIENANLKAYQDNKDYEDEIE